MQIVEQINRFLISSVLPLLLQVFPEAESVAAEPEAFALASVAAARSPGVVWTAEPAGLAAVELEGPDPGVVAAAAARSPRAAWIAEPGLVSAVELEGPGPEIVAVADFVESRASVDIAVAFPALVPVSVVAVEVDSSERPRSLAFPSADHYASSSSSVGVVRKESVHSSTHARTNYGLCSILSSLGPHQSKNLGHCYSSPSPGHNSVSDTNALPIDATTNHSRKTCLHLHQGQRKHRSYRASLSRLEVPGIRWAAAVKY